MAVIALTSAQGSPGVTTTVLGLALAWPRPCLLVDADPTGASAILAGYFHGQDVASNGTLIDLAIAHRHGRLAEDLPGTTMRIPDSSVDFLPGATSHAQAHTLETLWDPLVDVLRGLGRNGQDVLVDAGRLGLAGSPEALLATADLTLLVTRSRLPALVGAKSWADTLRKRFTLNGAPTNLGVLLIGAGQPYSAGNVASVLELPVVASLAWDPVSAEVFSLGATPARRRFDGAPLSRSLHAAASAIRTVVAANRAGLGAAPTTGEAP